MEQSSQHDVNEHDDDIDCANSSKQAPQHELSNRAGGNVWWNFFHGGRCLFLSHPMIFDVTTQK